MKLFLSFIFLLVSVGIKAQFFSKETTSKFPLASFDTLHIHPQMLYRNLLIKDPMQTSKIAANQGLKKYNGEVKYYIPTL